MGPYFCKYSDTNASWAGEETKCITIFTLSFLDKHAWANNVDPDQMPKNVASDLSLHCLPLMDQYLDSLAGTKIDSFKF